MFSLPITNNKTDSDKTNGDIADLKLEIMLLKEFVLSEVCLLKKETRTSTSKYVSMENSNFSDPLNTVANERLLEKLEKENTFLRDDLQNKNIEILNESITGLSKKIITQSFFL